MSYHPRFIERKITTISPSINIPSYNLGVEDAARLLAQWAEEACGGAGSGPAYDALMSYSRSVLEKLTITPVMLRSTEKLP